MYTHRFEYIVIAHLIFMAVLAVYFAPWGLWLIPLVLLNLALFMIPGDLRFASGGKIRRAAALYKISLVANIALFVLGACLLFSALFLGVFTWYLAGMNLAIANRVARALKNIERHPPSPLARSTEENRALDAAAFWEKAAYFTDFALAGYIGLMIAGAVTQIGTADTVRFWGKWIWPGLLITALVIGGRRLRQRALDSATQAAATGKGDGATVTKPAFILDDGAIPAVVRGAAKKSGQKQRRQGGFIGETPANGQNGEQGISAQRLRQMGVTISPKGSALWQWLCLFIWLCLTLCGYYLWVYVPFYPSALSNKSGLLVIGLSTAVVLWLLALRIRRTPQKVALVSADKTALDSLFMIGSLFALSPLLLSMPLYTFAYAAHSLTAETVTESYPVKRDVKRQPCIDLLTEKEMRFCTRSPADYAAAVKEGKDLTFAIRRSIFGVSIDDYVPRHGELE